jgi:hypothetical protein
MSVEVDAATSDLDNYSSGHTLESCDAVIAVLPDKQIPILVGTDDIATFQWIANNKTSKKIAHVVSVGDNVNIDNPSSHADYWTSCRSAFATLDAAGLTYTYAQGNHDYYDVGSSGMGNFASRVTNVNSYFDVTGMAWIGGTYEAGHIENNWCIVTIGGRQVGFISLEFGPRSDVVDWAQTVLAAHSTVPFVLVTHVFTYIDGKRYDHIANPLGSGTDQAWSVYNYLFTGIAFDAEELWSKPITGNTLGLINGNSNVKLVLSGHYYPVGSARQTSVRADGTKCHQILGAYHTAPNDAVLLLGIKWGANKLIAQTYFPVKNETITGYAREFVVDFL